MKSLLLAIAVTVIAASGNAQAAEWSMNGSSCVADSSAIQGNHYLGTGGTVKHSAASTTTLVFYCPIDIPASVNSPATRLSFLYQDSTGALPVTTNFVKAQLIKMHRTTGVLTTIVTVNSNQSTGSPDFAATLCNNGGATSVCFNTFSEAFAPATYFYYVRVDIARNSTGNNEAFFGAFIN